MSGLPTPASCASVHPVGSVVVVSPLASATSVTFSVRAAWFSVGAGVASAATFASLPDERTAAAPVRAIPVTSTTTTSPAELDPEVHVTMNDTSVDPRRALRTKTAELFADAFQSAVPILVQVPSPSAWSSVIVGVAVVFTDSATNATRRLPATAVVTVANRSVVPVVAPPAVLRA